MTGTNVSRAIADGALAATLVGAELAITGARQARSAWAPINSAASLVMGKEASRARDFHPTITPLGFAVLGFGVAAWAAVDRAILRSIPVENAIARKAGAVGLGVLSAATMAFVEFVLLPSDRRPKLERWLSPAAIIGKYAVLALGIALPTLLRSKRSDTVFYR
jgi:hypothetical protein